VPVFIGKQQILRVETVEGMRVEKVEGILKVEKVEGMRPE